MNFTDDAVLTVEEAAKVLRIGRASAYELARRGDLPVLDSVEPFASRATRLSKCYLRRTGRPRTARNERTAPATDESPAPERGTVQKVLQQDPLDRDYAPGWRPRPGEKVRGKLVDLASRGATTRSAAVSTRS